MQFAGFGCLHCARSVFGDDGVKTDAKDGNGMAAGEGAPRGEGSWTAITVYDGHGAVRKKRFMQFGECCKRIKEEDAGQE